MYFILKKTQLLLL